MKNIFKAFTIMILAFALSIPMQIIVKASTYTNIVPKENVVASKPWTINFNKPLSVTTVNPTNIKVVGEDNEYIDIKVTLANSNKDVIVEAAKNYEYNKTYTLIVTQNVLSYDGKPLPNEVRMDFTTKSAPTSPSEFTVCIDPAQYYKEITGSSGVRAKDINLSIALKLGNILKARGFNVVYTRDTDAVTWTQSGEDAAKALIAKNENADVFLSINTNSAVPTAYGIESYYTPDVSQNKLLATSVQAELIKATGAYNRGINIASTDGNFAVLGKTSCPAISAYLGFISNPTEEILLSSDEYQNNEAKAIANGLMNYAGVANTDTVYDSVLKIVSIPDISASLAVGSKYTLPTTVEANMSNNSRQTVGVVWLPTLVTTNMAGVSTYYGTVKDFNTKVKAIITVKATAKYKVVLDSGHGGTDPGAVGPAGTEEKVIAIAIAIKIRNILVKNGVDVVYTRVTNEQTISLQERCDVSNNAKPDYFVSIHANGFSSPSASGIETYSTGSAAGSKLAQAVQTELIKATGRLDRGIKTAGYYVLNNTAATAILVETSFITNPTEESLLKSATYQSTLAKAISTGILKCLGITNIVY
ncbi:MAG TPA: N-acetylmuramoyl-L-alanine amidase [Clostridium sp.]|uniref:N-acetylmuramoyl-L-alanine amidase n=1 Tax=Clostridium sp. TaxID=1506 RepID=UPI002F95C047